MDKQLLKGNEAIAEAAIRAGVEGYFGYPITPQTELLEYMALRLPELGRVFLQAESEVAAVNMVYGAACTGARVMTSSSSPGVSLMMEGLSYIAGSEVPCVLVDVMRGGPGLGNIAPSQGDYFQMVKGGGHGDYRFIVLAPASVQEAIDLTYEAFDLAEKYRTVVVVLADGNIGQMMEPALLPPMREVREARPDWALTGNEGRDKHVVTSIYLKPEEMEDFNLKLQRTVAEIRENEVRYVEDQIEDAEYLIVGFGTAGRVAQTAIKHLREEGVAAGLFRPVSLFPFPEDRLKDLAARMRGILVVEMNGGQMLEDIERIAGHLTPIHFYGRMGGMVPLPEEIMDAMYKLVDKVAMSERRAERWS